MCIDSVRKLPARLTAFISCRSSRTRRCAQVQEVMQTQCRLYTDIDDKNPAEKVIGGIGNASV